MIVRTLTSILNTSAHVKGDAFESRRILLAADGLGYSLHDTLCKAGSAQLLEYKNHVETNYVIEGMGEVVNVATGQVWPLGPGTVYVLDHNEAHILRATTDLRIICVFTPALTGQEKHDASGSYPAPAAGWTPPYGVNKLNWTRELVDTPSVRGTVNKINHLVPIIEERG